MKRFRVPDFEFPVPGPLWLTLRQIAEPKDPPHLACTIVTRSSRNSEPETRNPERT
jgi:hypothetical protein